MELQEKKVYLKIKIWHTHFDGKKLLNKWYYEMHYLSHNFRIDFQCALGISQLNKIDLLVKNDKIASIYKKLIINEKNNYNAYYRTLNLSMLIIYLLF